MVGFFVSDSNSKGSNSPVPSTPSTPALSASDFISSSPNLTSNVQYFSCGERGHYVYECHYHTLILEEKSRECIELKEEVVELEGSL